MATGVNIKTFLMEGVTSGESIMVEKSGASFGFIGSLGRTNPIKLLPSILIIT